MGTHFLVLFQNIQRKAFVARRELAFAANTLHKSVRYKRPSFPHGCSASWAKVCLTVTTHNVAVDALWDRRMARNLKAHRTLNPFLYLVLERSELV